VANNIPPLLRPAQERLRQQVDGTVKRFHQQNDASEKLIGEQQKVAAPLGAQPRVPSAQRKALGLAKVPSGQRKALGAARPSGQRKALDQQNKTAEEGIKRGFDALLKQTEGEGRLPTAEEIQALTGGTGATPYINQIKPADRPPQYQGAMYCGPTVMAMIARARGFAPELTDAQLIERFAKVGGTTPEGTSGNGLIAIGQELGMNARPSAGADLRFIDGELAQGRAVVAQGDYWALPPHADPGQDSGHFILVQGRDPAGNYRVNDPMTDKVAVITADTLRNYIQSAQGGGFSVSFG